MASTLPTQDDSFPFLQLPAEIRNRIVGLLPDNKVSSTTPRPRSEGSRKQQVLVHREKNNRPQEISDPYLKEMLQFLNQSHGCSPGNQVHKTSVLAGSLGRFSTDGVIPPNADVSQDHRASIYLASTCKQLRKEVYPIWWERDEIEIDFRRASNFVTTFFRGQGVSLNNVKCFEIKVFREAMAPFSASNQSTSFGARDQITSHHVWDLSTFLNACAVSTVLDSRCNWSFIPKVSFLDDGIIPALDDILENMVENIRRTDDTGLINILQSKVFTSFYLRYTGHSGQQYPDILSTDWELRCRVSKSSFDDDVDLILQCCEYAAFSTGDFADGVPSNYVETYLDIEDSQGNITQRWALKTGKLKFTVMSSEQRLSWGHENNEDRQSFDR